MTNPITRPTGAALIVAAGAIAASALTLPAQAQPTPGFCDFSAVDARARRVLADFPQLDGIGVIVGDRSGVVHEAYFGDYTPATIVPLASASKLISATAIMTLVESGLLNLNAPVRSYLPEYAAANAGLQKSTLTADQMYSMTSGFPGEDAGTILGDRSITNDEAVEMIACCVPLASQPGTDFRYGGLGMHTVGRVAEVLTGLEFDAFFEAALSRPLGLTTISWDGLGETENFRPSGGAASSLPDYARILRMLLRRGEIDGVRILSPGLAQSMFVERTVGLPQAEVPPAAEPSFGYAFGMWVEARNDAGFPTVVSSPGAFGFTPVLDLEDNYFVAVMVRGQNGQLDPSIDAIRGLVDTVMAQRCRSCAADLDRSGSLNINDILLFAGDYNAGLPSADTFADLVFDINDVLAFAQSYNDGCP